MKTSFFSGNGAYANSLSGFARAVRRYEGASAYASSGRYWDAEGRLLDQVVVRKLVPGHQAEGAGIKPGDVILRYDGREIGGDLALFQSLVKVSGDHRRELVLLRQGQPLTLEVEPGMIGVELRLRVSSEASDHWRSSGPRENPPTK